MPSLIDYIGTIQFPFITFVTQIQQMGLRSWILGSRTRSCILGSGIPALNEGSWVHHFDAGRSFDGLGRHALGR